MWPIEQRSAEEKNPSALPAAVRIGSYLIACDNTVKRWCSQPIDKIGPLRRIEDKRLFNFERIYVHDGLMTAIGCLSSTSGLFQAFLILPLVVLATPIVCDKSLCSN